MTLFLAGMAAGALVTPLANGGLQEFIADTYDGGWSAMARSVEHARRAA